MNSEQRQEIAFWLNEQQNWDLLKLVSYVRENYGIAYQPNAPEQNPMEDVWLQVKNLIRKNYHQLENFQMIKDFFWSSVKKITLRSKKIDWYSRLQII